MQVLIHITLSESSFLPYNQPLLQWMHAALPEVLTFDMDSHSHSSLAEHALKLVKQADQACVLFVNSGNQEASPGAGLQILQFAARQREKTLKVKLLGNHALIEKMGKVLPAAAFNKVADEETARKELSAFFSHRE